MASGIKVCSIILQKCPLSLIKLGIVGIIGCRIASAIWNMPYAGPDDALQIGLIPMGFKYISCVRTSFGSFCRKAVVSASIAFCLNRLSIVMLIASTRGCIGSLSNF